jgi:predicted O-methyltransferase YrrM
VPDRVNESGRYFLSPNVQYVLVINLEDLGHQAGADRVGLTGIAIDNHLHRTPSIRRGSRLPQTIAMNFVLSDAHRRYAEAATGFMPPAEGEALSAVAAQYAHLGPIVEIGTYCGKSTIYLAAAAAHAGQFVVTVDHHRGSEENQAGWEYHDASLVDQATGLLDTLPFFRATLAASGLEQQVIAIVGRSADVARLWRQPVGMLFIDGGHTDAAVTADYEGWAPHVAMGGVLAIHDVFPNPADGGQPPYRIYCRAVASGSFKDLSANGSLRVLQRTSEGIG